MVTMLAVRRFFGNKINVFFLVVGVLLELALWTYSAFTVDANNQTAFLHYTVGVGVDFVGQGTKVYIISAIGGVILLINAVVAYTLYERLRFVSYFFLLLADWMQVYLILSVLLVASLNF